MKIVLSSVAALSLVTFSHRLVAADEPAQPADAKPAETKPAETKPAETKPADAKPADPQPGEAKPAEAKPAAPKLSPELKAGFDPIIGKIREKVQAKKKTAEDFSEEFKQLDELVNAHKADQTQAPFLAQFLMVKVQLYGDVIEDAAKAKEVVMQIKTDFPETSPGKNADRIVQNIDKSAAAKKIQRTLVAGSTFPDFDAKDLEDKPLSVARFKGQVVLVDFWATWCGPCMIEMPNVLKAYEKYHDKGFEIIGISLDQDKDKLLSVIKSKNMTWPQQFDGKGWANEVSTKYGVMGIPESYLIDKEGKIIASGLRGEELDKAIATALGL